MLELFDYHSQVNRFVRGFVSTKLLFKNIIIVTDYKMKVCYQ